MARAQTKLNLLEELLELEDDTDTKGRRTKVRFLESITVSLEIEEFAWNWNQYFFPKLVEQFILE